MKLLLKRFNNTQTTCIGNLFIGVHPDVVGAPDDAIDWNHECFTLEDIVRLDDPNTLDNESAKVYGRTAIPAGTYEIALNESPKFGKIMPRLLNVPGFSGILIHSGNDAEDTLGCILVGTTVESDSRIHGGTKAFPALMAKLDAAKKRGDRIWITIENSFSDKE